MQNWGKVNLFTRPRRFGKTLNMSMLKSFFEIGCNPALFTGLKIAQESCVSAKNWRVYLRYFWDCASGLEDTFSIKVNIATMSKRQIVFGL